MRVYIAGPMSIIGPPTYNYPAFDAAAKRWRDAGYEVESPAEITREYWQERFHVRFDPATADPALVAPGTEIYDAFLRLDVAAISRCHAIALLPGWRPSSGVAKELAVAAVLKLPLYDADTMQPLKAETILEEAQRLVHGDRQSDYGHPLDNWTLTADLCNPIIKRAIAEKGYLNAEDLLKVMVQVKVAREINVGKRDNRTDICGYTECLDLVIAERHRRARA